MEVSVNLQAPAALPPEKDPYPLTRMLDVALELVWMSFGEN